MYQELQFFFTFSIFLVVNRTFVATKGQMLDKNIKINEPKRTRI